MIKDLIELLKQLGVSGTILVVLGILGSVGGIISAVVKLIHSAILKNNQWLLNENLRPYFSTSDVARATRYYIPTKFQNISPLADDEPGRSHIASAKQLLLPMFLKKAFKNNGDNVKHYLILADAGMGKTTFMINLFLSYTARPIKNLFGSNENQGMKLFPLGSPDIWKDIEKIENKRDTILLLDAFDEDIKAVDDYDVRMKEILEATKDFKEIVITCRTQFFLSDKEIPDDTGYTTFGGDQSSYKFQRVYLSVFDEKGIRKYLKKRFSFFQFSKRRKAFEIVKKSPNLVMRPMLLSYINDFVEANRTFKHSYEIYEVLIDKWIERESKKHGIRNKYGSEEKYRELLLNFSQTLAINLYENSEERGGYYITKDDFIKDKNGLQITDVEDYGMTEIEIRSKSLLNRDAEGKYKFSHKSIFEYFLAKELIQNGNFLSMFDFNGMDVTQKFIIDVIKHIGEQVGEFWCFGESSQSLKQLSLMDLKKITKLKITHFDFFRPTLLEVFINLQELTISNIHTLRPLYEIYEYVGKQLLNKQRMEDFAEFSKLPSLKERLEKLTVSDFQELNNNLPYLAEREYLNETIGLSNALEKTKLYLTRSAYFNSLHKEKRLKKINDYLKDMKLLQEKLPNCKMIY